MDGPNSKVACLTLRLLKASHNVLYFLIGKRKDKL